MTNKLVYRLALFIYYSFAIYLPESYKYKGLPGKIRRILCKHIFLYCGKSVNVEKGARFGNGRFIEIGDYSGIGINCTLPNNVKIGKYVMMGPNCYILDSNHNFDSIDKPMMFQGYSEKRIVHIDNDVWLGVNVTIMPGIHFKKGTIVGAGSVVTKNFPEYSIIGGNPAKLIRDRKQ